MSDGYEAPVSLAAAPLGVLGVEEPACPLAVLPCLVSHLTGRFPAFFEVS
jgi:hypothetical protein